MISSDLILETVEGCAPGAVFGDGSEPSNGYGCAHRTVGTMSALEAAADELRDLGLHPAASAHTIARRLQEVFPGGLTPGLANPATGLPFSSRTAEAHAYGRIMGSIPSPVGFFPARSSASSLPQDDASTASLLGGWS